MGLFFFLQICAASLRTWCSQMNILKMASSPPKKTMLSSLIFAVKGFFFSFQNNLQQRFPALKKQKQKRKERKRISTSSNIKQKKNVKITYVMCRWAGVKGKSVDIIPLVWQSLDYKKNSPILPPNFFFFFLRSSHLNHLILSPSSLPL